MSVLANGNPLVHIDAIMNDDEGDDDTRLRKFGAAIYLVGCWEVGVEKWWEVLKLFQNKGK